MKALRYDGPHQLCVVELPIPEPAAGEALLRVGGCGICGSDVHGYTGESGRRVAGQVMGHEFAGTIAKLGPGATGWRVGQRVAAYNIIGCGTCAHCATVNPQRCPTRKVIGVNTGTLGAYAEFVTAPLVNLAELADGVEFGVALLNEPLAVALHALRRLPSGVESLCIVGGGTIGQCLAMAARALAIPKVFVLEPLPDKRAMAERSGAIALPPDLELLKQHLPDGADAAVEAVGVEATVRTALESIKPGGTLVLLGNLAKEVSLPLQHISSNEKHLIGTYGFGPGDFRDVVAWINAGKFDLAPMLSGELSLEDCPQAFADLASGVRQAIKLVVRP